MKKVSMATIMLRWLWTYPACLIVALISEKTYGHTFQFSDNYFLTALFFIFGLGGIIAYIAEIIIRKMNNTLDL